MPSASLNINQIALDSQFYVWGSGEDVRRFNGSSWEYYNYLNSAVPGPFGGSFSLDTRTVSIDPEEKLWCGVAEGPTSGFNEVAVFYINTNDVDEGESWRFSDLGDFGGIPQETSFVYACPFGDDVYAFVTPLNGIGGTAGISNYTRFYGVTGGRLFYHLKETGQWKETIPNYPWPHIYDMQAKGIDGKSYFYYVATNEGLMTIPQGSLSTVELTDGTQIIKQAQVYNTHTSGIISDNVYALDLDEDGNLWMGTDKGLSFFNGHGFWNYGTTGPVTAIKSRPNGHVFYSTGDGELGQGAGLWHFNGSTHTLFTNSNSTLSSNNIIDIELVGGNIDQSGLIAHENALWVLEYNVLSSFDYDIPHVYGSSKYAGATGWNFVYYSPTGGTSAPLPKVNKYTWTYPEWRVYQDDYLASKHPGLDPRNLFMTTKLSAIADGRAGKQPYWDNFPLPSYEQEVWEGKVTGPTWIKEIALVGTDAGYDYPDLKITCSTTLNVDGSTKLYIGGEISGNTTGYLGYYNDTELATVVNLNPTMGGSAASVLDSNSGFFAKMGFIACYDEDGYVESVLPFRGYSTKIDSLSPSADGNSIIATGSYNWLIENGPYVYPGWLGATNTYLGGPTGAPIGLTNINVPGATTGIYNWITSVGQTGSNFFYTYSGGSTSTLVYIGVLGPGAGNPGGIDFEYNVGALTQYAHDVSAITVNFIDFNMTDWSNAYEQLPTGYVITITDYVGTGEVLANYTIDSINLGNNGPGSTAKFNVTYQGGTSGNIDFNVITYSFLGFDVYSYLTSCFPLVPALETISSQESANIHAPGVFVAQIEKDLGDISSFAGITGDYTSDIRKSYRITDFRTFPSVNQVPSSTSETLNSIYSKSDTSANFVNVAIVSGATAAPSLSTLKNSWNRNNDNPSTVEVLKDPLSQNFMSYVRLNASDFSLQTTVNAEGSTSGYLYQGINSLNSLSNEDTVLITGNSCKDFSIGGMGLTGPTSSVPYPYFAIISTSGTGVTGYFMNDAQPGTGSINSSKDRSTYYVTSIYGGSGSYFREDFVAGSTGTYLLTAQITEQGVVKNTFGPHLETYASNIQKISASEIMPNGQYFISYSDYSIASFHLQKFLKSTQDGRITDTNYFSGPDPSTSLFNFSVSDKSDIYMSITWGNSTTAPLPFGYNYPYGLGSGNSQVIKAEQYKPDLGINLGGIISRPGSGAWTWCDVHSTDNYFEIPLMSTVILNNYASNIYGKQNNVWSLIDSSTDNDLLTVKSTPYFIYTFTQPGFYTVNNQVEDSQGNVYEVSKPGFIKVVDHLAKRPDDLRPEFVDSTDYGYPPGVPFYERDEEAKKLAAELLKDEKEILSQEIQPFGSDLKIAPNPDATFDEYDY